jgi:hypothetical protein
MVRGTRGMHAGRCGTEEAGAQGRAAQARMGGGSQALERCSVGVSRSVGPR